MRGLEFLLWKWVPRSALATQAKYGSSDGGGGRNEMLE